MAAKLPNTGKDARPLLDRKAPDVAKERNIEAVGATFGQIRTGPAMSH